MHPFAKAIQHWYTRHGRSLPWRGISDAYRIWISEVILQQTTVAQGRDYYLRFIERFPTVQSLAEASEEEVLALWQGLGYYSRARHLHDAARSIGTGKFPTKYADVRALKGVGDYTAAAICSIAYGLPHAVVDGNVYRVLARYFGIDTPIDTTEGKKLFAQLAADLLDTEKPALHNQAMMDFGALQCVPHSPDCTACPLVESCRAAEEGTIAALPVKAKRTAVKNRHFVYVVISEGERIYLRRRTGGDIWEGLYEPLLMEFDHAPTTNEVIERIKKEYGEGLTDLTGIKTGMKHILTHRRIFADLWTARVTPTFPREDFRAATPEELADIPLPRLVSRMLTKYYFK